MNAGEQGDQLPYLETFSKAAELSNFTEAAKALKLTQAAVSQRVQALERSIGKSLFQRRGGRGCRGERRSRRVRIDEKGEFTFVTITVVGGQIVPAHQVDTRAQTGLQLDP